MAGAWESVLAAATKALTPRLAGQTEPSRYALDRALRLVRVIDAIAAATPQPELPARVDLARIAALYCCLPLAAQPFSAAAKAPLPDDSAEFAADQLKSFLPAGDVELVLHILRAHRTRAPAIPEACLLSDAVALEDFGLVGVWTQTRAFHAAGKTLDQLLRLWKTQHEYGYWNTRLTDGLHFEAARAAARRRLDALHTIFDRLSRENAATDIG